MAVNEQLRWFWHLSGDLEDSPVEAGRRSLHRALSFGTTQLAAQMLRSKKSTFRRKPPEPPFSELLLFLRRLRWAVLWQMADAVTTDDLPEDRSTVATSLLTEALSIYPTQQCDRSFVESLFYRLGETSHSDQSQGPKLQAATENLLAMPIIYRWLAQGDGFEKARRKEDSIGLALQLRLTASYSAGLLDEQPELCQGVSGLPHFDVAFARAVEAGPGNYAFLCLVQFESVEPESIIALKADALWHDTLGDACLELPGQGLFGSGPRTVRITPFTRVALLRYLEGRTVGPMFRFGDGRAVSETTLNTAYLQAAGSAMISGDAIRF